MNVLHYSFSLSACPKCHLLVCKHTSLANLDFNPIQPSTPSLDNQSGTRSHNDHQKSSSTYHGINFYVFPMASSNNNYSWTTSGRESIKSDNTIDQFSSDNETVCDNTPFADEQIVNSSSTIQPLFHDLVRTQSERGAEHFKPNVSMMKSLSFSTICNKSSTSSSSSWSPIKPIDSSISHRSPFSRKSFSILLILIISFLITNTLDIVLIYIYYYDEWINFILFLSTLVLCDLVLWIHQLIEWKSVQSRILLFPFMIRFYLLYELVDLMTVLFDKRFLKTARATLSEASSSSGTRTTDTLEMQISETINGSILSSSPSYSSYKRTRQRLYQRLALFYLIHSGFLTLINLYLWSNHFHLSAHSSLTMISFLPQWQTPSSSISIETTLSATSYWLETGDENDSLARRTISSNWTNSLLGSSNSFDISLSTTFSSYSSFVLFTILYHLIPNYSILSTILVLPRPSFLPIISIFSRLCLIVTRLYALLFLIRLHTWWLPATFILVHLALITTLLFDQTKLLRKRYTIFLQIIFSLITHSPIDDRSINVLISLENASIFLHRLYLETFADGRQTVFPLTIFISILISFQVIGFIFDTLTKHLLDRSNQRRNKSSIIGN